MARCMGWDSSTSIRLAWRISPFYKPRTNVISVTILCGVRESACRWEMGGREWEVKNLAMWMGVGGV